MTLNQSWVLLGVTVLFWLCISCKDYYQKKKLPTQSKFFKNLGIAADLTLGVYAFFYALAIIGFNIFDINAQVPQDNAALTVALLYGGAKLIYPKLLTLFTKK